MPQIVLLPRKCKSNFCSSDTRQTIISAVRKFPPRNFSSPTYLRFYKHRGMALTHKHKLSFPFAHPLRSFPVRSQHDQPCSLAPPSFSMPLFSLLNCSCNINPERIKATRFLAESGKGLAACAVGGTARRATLMPDQPETFPSQQIRKITAGGERK